ncbi:MAG: hypothetical protein EOO02_25180, partial [Chitinophagaceae bacterium]
MRKQLSIGDSAEQDADVFMHIDKTVYPVTEDVWFSTYLFNAANPESYHTLYVTLVNDMTGKVVTSQRYMINNGISSGCINLPDTISGGDYSIIAYTNQALQNRSQNYFRQPVTIIGSGKPPFVIEFVNQQRAGDKDSSIVLFKVGTSYGGLASKGTIEYSLYRNDIFTRKHKVLIDAFGEAPLLRTKAGTTDRYEVSGKVFRDKDTMLFRSEVNKSAGENTITFYPEGGRLVAGTPAKVAFEIRTASGKGISTKAGLYKNNEFVAALESDVYGLGRFFFEPEAEAEYKVIPADGTV